MTAWDPNPDGAVNTLVRRDATIFAGGNFANVGGQPRSRLAALDGATGLALAGVQPRRHGRQRDRLGPFGVGLDALRRRHLHTLGGMGRNFIGAVDATTGVLSATFNPSPSSTIAALAASGTTVYAGGFFNSIGGQTRPGLAALDGTTGAALVPFNPGLGGQVLTIDVSGSTLYVGGTFSGQGRSNVAAVKAASGAVQAWNPGADAGVTALRASGSTAPMVGAIVTAAGK